MIMNDLKKYGYIGSDLVPKDRNKQYEDTEFVDILGDDIKVQKKPTIKGLGRNNLVIDNYGIISDDEDSEEEEKKE